MKLLLTSGGVTNPSIHSALVQLLGKPIAECHALCVPTAQWGHPMCGPTSVRGFVAAEPELAAPVRPGLGVARCPRAHRTAHHRRGAMGPLDPGGRRAPGRRRRRDVPVPLDAGVRAGRSAAFAARHGLGGSECRKHGDDAPDRSVLRGWPSAPDDRTLGVVDFSIFPHLDAFPTNTMADAERWAAEIGVPAYAIDEQTAIKVVDGSVEVVSEGQWTKFGS